MDIDLRLPSGDHDKEGEEPNGGDNMSSEVKLHNGNAETGSVVDVAEEILSIEGGDVNSPTPATFKEDTNLEPLSGMGQSESMTSPLTDHVLDKPSKTQKMELADDRVQRQTARQACM
ncbi:hypothetical protein OIU74_002761 [Salix koriyanagi]|uniref:Uncharacterized protein n=1 Tax=Salix koriyanagi TaxID=2511006 RepID=A0A9Q0X4Z9_9ROSI|nr:hypothetical protein OIU74_002761 [Salix koriyanagi]